MTNAVTPHAWISAFRSVCSIPSLSITLVALSLVLSPRDTVDAHPFGLASVNRYLGVQMGPSGTVQIAYLLDFAELPASVEISRIDRDRDGAITPTERDAYLDTFLPPIVASWVVEINGIRVTPRVIHRTLEAPLGDNGLHTLRILAELSIDPPDNPAPDGTVTVRLHDPAFSERSGWREIRADDSPDGTLVFSSVPDRPVGTAATSSTPMLRIDQAVFRFRPRAAIDSSAGVVPTRASRSVQSPWWIAHRRVVVTVLFVLALVGITAALAMRTARGRGLIAIDPRIRVALTVAMTLSVTLCPAGWFGPLIAHAILISVLLVAARPRVRWVLHRLALALGWSALIALIRAATEGHHSTVADSLSFMSRITLALTATLPLAATTSLTALANALAELRLPSAFVEAMASTARGLVLLRDEALRLARARQLRAPCAGLLQRLSLYGSLAGSLIERGLRRSERAYLAMTLRGFDGKTHVPSKPLTVQDVSFCLACLAALAAAHGFQP